MINTSRLVSNHIFVFISIAWSPPPAELRRSHTRYANEQLTGWFCEGLLSVPVRYHCHHRRESILGNYPAKPTGPLHSLDLVISRLLIFLVGRMRLWAPELGVLTTSMLSFQNEKSGSDPAVCLWSRSTCHCRGAVQATVR
jgi:hypothetical protein